MFSAATRLAFTFSYIKLHRAALTVKKSASLFPLAPILLFNYSPEQAQAGVGREALALCKPQLEAYTACIRKHGVPAKELAVAPQHYTSQLGAPDKK